MGSPGPGPRRPNPLQGLRGTSAGSEKHFESERMVSTKFNIFKRFVFEAKKSNKCLIFILKIFLLFYINSVREGELMSYSLGE